MKVICLILACLPALATAQQSPAPDTDALLAGLRDGNMEVRVEALRGLQTSLDPRLPGALLPLLADEGNSIRRLAARAVGSRYWQIAPDSRAAFLKPLKALAKADDEGERNMARRASGLLKGDFGGDMFARSANKRWVIYERRGLPCLIDTDGQSEELLGWSTEDYAWMPCAWGNGAIGKSVLWHPRDEAAAIDILLGRHFSTVWVWLHGTGLRKLDPAAVRKTLGLPAEEGGMLYAELKEWKGDALLVTVTATIFPEDGGDPVETEAVLAWNPAEGTLQMVSRK